MYVKLGTFYFLSWPVLLFIGVFILQNVVEIKSETRWSGVTKRYNIVFLLDISFSINSTSLDIAKEFMRTLVDTYGVSDRGGRGTKFGLVKLSSDDDNVFPSVYGVEELNYTRDSSEGGTDYERSLIGVIRYFFNYNRYFGADKAVFLITDTAKESYRTYERRPYIKRIIDDIKRGWGIDIFVIGVGQRIDKTLMNEIASDPYIEHVFYLNRFTDLKYIAGIISGQSVQFARAPVRGETQGHDIVFLLDTSSSIGSTSLDIAKGFMRTLVDMYGVSPKSDGRGNGTRFSLVTFNSVADDVFTFVDPKARTKEGVKELINKIASTGGGTDFVEALSKVRYNFWSYERPGANKAVFLITDAEDTAKKIWIDRKRREYIVEMSYVLKEEGIEIFVIGVGQTVDKTLMDEIASEPYIEHVFYLDKFTDLNYIGGIISGQSIDYGQCGVSDNTVIVENKSLQKGALPWLGWFSVFLDDGSIWTCGGSLLCDKWFVTAASCVTRRSKDGKIVTVDTTKINLVLGDQNLFKKDDTEQQVVVEGILVHPNYTGEQNKAAGVAEYDIALLDLGQKESSRPVLQKSVRPLCFPTDNTSLTMATAAMVAITALPRTVKGYFAGWGHSQDNLFFMKRPLNDLIVTEMPVTRKEICEKVYNGLDAEKFFCVGDDFQYKTCVGDIGGPYMVKIQRKLYAGIGLALRTRDCNKHGHYNIYLNLLHSSIIDWVTPILDGCNRYKIMKDQHGEDSDV